MMKKVLFIITNLDSGGIENYLLRFLKHYDGKLLPTVLCISGDKGTLESEYLKIENIRIKTLRIGFFDLIGLYKLKQYLEKEKFDTIVDFRGHFAGLPILISKFAGIKNRITFYRGATNHFNESFFKLRYNNFVGKLVKTYSTHILSNSQAALNFFFKNQKDPRFEVIYNGIKSDEFLNTNEKLRNELSIPENAFVISHVGRFTKEKNHSAIINVAKVLCKEYDDVYFILCGKDVDLELQKVIENEKIEDRVRVLGFRRDIIKVLNSSDAFYFPSYTEGQPNALIEAMIAGLPIVASNIDPIKETIPADFHFLLTDPNDVDASILLLEKYYQNKSFRNSINFKNWAIENYNPNILFEKFYNKL